LPYESYRAGKRRLVVFESVKRDRMRALLAEQARKKTGKRPVGRPRNSRLEASHAE
jgi:hypothetical protein